MPVTLTDIQQDSCHCRHRCACTEGRDLLRKLCNVTAVLGAALGQNCRMTGDEHHNYVSSGALPQRAWTVLSGSCGLRLVSEQTKMSVRRPKLTPGRQICLSRGYFFLAGSLVGST